MRKYAKEDVIMEQTIKYLEKFYAEEGNSREDRFKSDLEDMKRVGYEEGLNMVIKTMHENNFSVNDISKATKMSVNKIKKVLSI